MNGLRGAYVDVPTTHHDINGGFSVPMIDRFFDTEEGTPVSRSSVDVGRTLLYVYWNDYREDVNRVIFQETGVSFHGDLLLFRKKRAGNAFVNMRKGDAQLAVAAIIL